MTYVSRVYTKQVTRKPYKLYLLLYIMESKQIIKNKEQERDKYTKEEIDYKNMPIGELVRTLQKDPDTIRQARELIKNM